VKQGLQLRMSQHLALTPQLQQSIRLLQLSTLELNQEIEQLLADNPLLERADSPFDSSLRVAGDGTVQTGGEASFEGPSGDGPGEDATKSIAEEQREDAPVDLGHDLLMGEPRTRGALDDDSEPPQLCGVTETLREHLLSQLSTTKASHRDRALVAVLIDAIDEDGYLRTPLEEIAELLPAELDVTVDELSMGLTLLQSFDPPGVGARNASECLLLQVRDVTLPAIASADATTRRNAALLAGQHLDLLAQRDFSKLKRVLKTDDTGLRAAHALLLRLDPYPGRRFGHHASNFIVADVIVKKRKGVWHAMLNPEVMPQLRINRVYAQILREHRGNEQVASLSSRLQEARWLIKNVQQRFETILRVAQAIVERQRNFFTHGEVAMRPLVLREIADTLGLHESTISRVTTQKYMLTPLGTFELKYFFGSHVATDAGGAASSTAIRALIKQLIGAEDPKKPLSDSKIAELLGEQGIVVARRTIAKYREALRIPPVSLRKTL
jgi:RNA polymerase sigma-54 factor